VSAGGVGGCGDIRLTDGGRTLAAGTSEVRQLSERVGFGLTCSTGDASTLAVGSDAAGGDISTGPAAALATITDGASNV